MAAEGTAGTSPRQRGGNASDARAEQGAGDPFAAALPLVEEALWRRDVSSGRMHLSPGWISLMGAGAGDGEDWRLRVHPEDRGRVDAHLATAQRGEAADRAVECRMRHGDGTWHWMRIRAAPTRGPDGGATALVGTIADVSEQYRNQDILERLVRHNSLILDAVGDGIYCLDDDGRGTFVNPAAARLLGTEVGRLMGMPLCAFRPGCGQSDGDPHHDPACPIDATLRTGLAHRVYDGRFRRADGIAFPVEYVVSPLKEGGVPHGAVVVFGDVTERRWSEDTIRRERRFSDGLIKSSLDGIVAFDTDLRFTIWNPAMERMTGLRASATIGRKVDQVLPFLQEAGDIADLRATLEGRTVVGYDRPFEVPGSGRSGYYEARFAPLYDDDGVILGGVGIIHETTEEKRHVEEVRAARRELERAEKLAALGTLVSGVGHELRTPMSYINNHLYLLKMLAERMRQEEQDMAPIADEIIKRTDSSMKGITRMSTLLDDLRATYRTSETDAKEADLKEVVREALRLFTGAYEGPVKVEKDLQETGPLLLETDRVQQVVINLLNNAAEAMGAGGTIRVTVWPLEDGAELRVADEGQGMDPDVKAAVFTPFYTTKKQGSGLGLYLVKQIVDRHLGTIECESAPGKGTTFRIFLPGQRIDPGEGAGADARDLQTQVPEGEREH